MKLAHGELLNILTPLETVVINFDKTKPLSDYIPQLDNLSIEEQISYADKVTLKCPEKKLAHLQEDLLEISTTPSTFIQHLQVALQIKSTLFCMSELKDTEAHKSLLLPSFNAAEYKQHRDLVSRLVLKRKSITLNMFLHASEEDRHQIQKNLHTCIQEQGFFELLSDISLLDAFLIKFLSDPFNALLHTEFNVTLCEQYPQLVYKRLSGHEQELADALFEHPDRKENKHNIMQELECLQDDSHHRYPFSVIHRKYKAKCIISTWSDHDLFSSDSSSHYSNSEQEELLLNSKSVDDNRYCPIIYSTSPTQTSVSDFCFFSRRPPSVRPSVNPLEHQDTPWNSPTRPIDNAINSRSESEDYASDNNFILRYTI